MADIEVTLNHSENYSESTAKKYRGYVINLCDNSHVDDGTWAVTSNSYTGYKINSNKIDVWNINTTSSDKSATFTWTSSKVDGCTKTLKVTVPGAVVTLKSGNTKIVVTAIYDKSGTVYNTLYEDEFLINGSSEGIVTTLNVLTGETITTCNGDMDNYWNNYIPSTSNTNNMRFAFNNGLNTHLIGCGDDYNSSGSFTINLKYYDCEMTISFPVTFNLISYVWYISTNGGSSWSKCSEYNITINVNNDFSVGEFVRVAYCAENKGDCADSYTIINGNSFTLNKKFWRLSDLNSSGNNCAIFRNDSTLINDLKNSNEHTYHISGDIVSSIGSKFPINVYYEVGKNIWYKFEGGLLYEITELNKNKIVLPETVINEMIVFVQYNIYITDASKYSYEQTSGDLTINLSFELRQISASVKCMGIKINATDSEMAKLYSNDGGSIIFSPNVSGNIICEENKLPVSFTFQTPFRIHILYSSYEKFPDIIHYVEMGLIEKENFGNTSGIHEIINGSKMHYNMYRYNTNSDNTRYKYIFVDIYYHTGDISTAMLKCIYPPASSSVIVQKSYRPNHPDNIDNLRIVIPHNTDTEYFADFVFTATK